MNQICNLLNKIDICLIWRKGCESDLQPRPMTWPRNDLAGGLWYFSQRNSRLMSLYGDSPQVTVAVSCPDLKQGASLSGHASIVDHKPSLAYFNVKANESLLPAGVEPEELVLLKIELSQLDFWEWESGTLIYSTSNSLNLTVTDQPPPTDGLRSFSCT